MSTLLIGAMVIAGTVAIFMLFIFVNKQNSNRQNKALLSAFNHTGAVRGLSFSSQQVLNNKIIGLDGLRQQLLILDFAGDNTVTQLPLDEVKDCTIKKSYKSVDYGNAKKSAIEQELQSIAVEFTFKNRPGNFTLSFYDSKLNSVYEMAELEAKARDWQVLLSKLVSKDMEARA